MKNWQPLEFGPEFAIDNNPGPVCFSWKFSSGKFFPYIENAPVPSPFMKSPPWHMKLGTTLWNVAPLYPIGRASFLYSPVQSCLKFSAVFGTMSLKSSILMRPAGVSPMWISMNTTGRAVDDIGSGGGGLDWRLDNEKILGCGVPMSYRPVDDIMALYLICPVDSRLTTTTTTHHHRYRRP